MRFDHYDTGGFYDEMFDAQGRPRPGTEAVVNRFDELSLEELKQKGKVLEFQHQKQMFALDLMEQRRLNTAKITQLNAQAVKLVKEAGAVDAGVKLQAVQTIIQALQAQNDMITQRLELIEGETDDTGTGSSSRRVV